AGGGGQAVDVARLDDTAGAVAPDGLGDAADVVRDGGHAGAERLQQRPALVELRPVREERDGRVAECAFHFSLRQIAEAPFGELAGLFAVAVHRLERVTGDEEPYPRDLLRGGDRVGEPLV